MINGAGMFSETKPEPPRGSRAMKATDTVPAAPEATNSGASKPADTTNSPPRRPRSKASANPIGTGDGSGGTDASGRPKAITYTHQPANIGAGAVTVPGAIASPPPSPIPANVLIEEGAAFALAADAPTPHPNQNVAREGAVEAADPSRGPPPHASIPALMALQRQRAFAIRQQGICTRSCESFIASHPAFAGVEDRKKVFERAKAIRLAVEKGASRPADSKRASPPRTASALAVKQSEAIATDENAIAEACAPIILNAAQARTGWDVLRLNAVKEMEALAKTLPVWAWAKDVRGLGPLGVAIIAAEASGPRGDVASYATKERLWKRLGLAVIDGQRQQKRADKDLAAAHGYNPRRRSEIWTIADSLFRSQWRGAKEDVAAHPLGPYGGAYLRRKCVTEGRDWSDARRDADARRVMTKALIEDYWRAWRRAVQEETSDG